MNWMITNMTTTDRTAEAIRSLDAIGGTREAIDINYLVDMLDFTAEQWTIVLTELDITGYAQLTNNTIQLNRTPEYDNIDR